MKKQQGFTLIELIMVIVILGILSAFALPRFANLSDDAREAAFNGGLAAIKSGAAIAHAACLADTNCPGTNAFVNLDGAPNLPVSTAGYPTATAAGIATAVSLDGYTLTAGTGTAAGTAAIKLDGYEACIMTYDEATGSVTTADSAGDPC